MDKLKKKELFGINSWVWGVVVFVLLIAIDLVTKIVADALWDPGDPSVKIIPGYLELCLVYNRGISFSIGSNAPVPAKIALVAATGVLFVLMGVFYFKMDKRRTWVRFALVFIVAGGVGNLIDRVYYQVWEPYSATDPTTWDGVRDMVRLKIFMFDFGVCNFADFFIVGGAIALIVAILFFDAGAIFPLTEKYKALSKEYEEKEEKKQAEKIRKAKAFALQKAAERKEEESSEEKEE
ncbi:MAG: signal peptidase II [Clostridia bacterium]|nr:signal peptidase II [Clostridia bacterium]